MVSECNQFHLMVPNQPRRFKFLKREFGNSIIVKRCFQPSWFNKWNLQLLWDESLCHCKDIEIKSRICGVSFYMENFDFLFGILTGELLLGHSENPSKILQSTDISAAEAQQIVQMRLKTLKDMRTEDSKFDSFWLSAIKTAEELGVGEPRLPRKRKYHKDLKQIIQLQTCLQQVINITTVYIFKHWIELLPVFKKYLINQAIGYTLTCHTDGEFGNDCLLTVIDIVCPKKRELFADISLSERTVTS